MPDKNPVEPTQIEFPIDIKQFQQQINNRTRMFLGNREFNAGIGRKTATYLALLGALGTIAVGMSGLETPYRTCFTVLALICTASTTGIQSWAGFFGHRQAHVFYADGYARLWSIRRDLEHVEKMPNGEVRDRALHALYVNFQLELSKLHQDWRTQQVEGAKGSGKSE